MKILFKIRLFKLTKTCKGRKSQPVFCRSKIDKNSGDLLVNGRVIYPAALVDDPILTMPTRHCFCLCLSNSRDSDELYDKFEADVCIEVNVELLLEFLKDFYSRRFRGMVVVGKDITYYDSYTLPKVTDPCELGFHAAEGEIIPFRKDDESMHMTFNYPDKEFLKQFIGKVYEPKCA